MSMYTWKGGRTDAGQLYGLRPHPALSDYVSSSLLLPEDRGESGKPLCWRGGTPVYEVGHSWETVVKPTAKAGTLLTEVLW